MTNYHNEIQISGEPELHASFGTVDIEIDHGTGEVALSLPDRFGHSTLYNFAPADWDRIVSMVKRAELERGVSTPAEWI